MSIDKAKLDRNDQCLHFDFDEWVNLNKTDPQAFERRRLEWCNRFIDGAQASNKKRLSGLLFQVNMERRRSTNAIGSCLRMTGLMWDKFNELRSELQHLASNPMPATQNTTSTSVQLLQQSADIIDFSLAATGHQKALQVAKR